MAESAKGQSSGGLLRAGALVGATTLLSRVLGLVRDVVLARVIGADALADAFFIAFRIPNFLRRLFAEGAFNQAFVPVLAEWRERGGQAAVRELIDRVAGALGAVLSALTAAVVVAAPLVALAFAPGFAADPARHEALSGMLRWTFPYLWFISLAGFAGAILNSYDRFVVPAFTPVWLNLCLIAAALLGLAHLAEPAWALAVGVFCAGAVQFCFQLPFLARLDLLPRPRLDWRHPGVRRILTLMAPALFGVSVSQVNLLFDTVIASFLPAGSVSWLYYSDRIAELPLGVIGVALGTVILPSLSRQHARNAAADFARTVSWAMRLILLVALPAALALVLLAEPILATLFHDGVEITRRDVEMSAWSLRAYALGLASFMAIKVLAPGFYARQDLKTPVTIGVVAMVANMVLNVAFVVPLHLLWQVGHAGLALATSLAAALNAGLLYGRLKGQGLLARAPGRGRYWLRLALANLALGGLLLAFRGEAASWYQWGAVERVVRLAALCVAGVALYGAVLAALGMRPADLRRGGSGGH
ncbi:MAG: putative lipid II flippase MurJ [Porticoccaceae bacterium]|nr:MAG: putative lipid II flippase MurJ [Porticoccaceae bacterium]